MILVYVKAFLQRSVGVIFLAVLGLVTLAVLTGFSPASQSLNSAEIEVIPSRPTQSDEIVIKLSGVWSDSCVPQNPEVSILESLISIDTFNPGEVCLQVITSWELTVKVGRLVPTDYDVVVTHHSPGSPIGIEIGHGKFSVANSPSVLVGLHAPDTVMSGARITVEIRTSQVTGLAGAELVLRYDPEVLSFADVTLVNGFRDCLSDFNNVGGSITLAFGCGDGHSGNELSLWHLAFVATEVDSPMKTHVEIASVFLSDDQFPPIEIPARGGAIPIVVTNGHCGDPNDDGKVNVLDVVIGLKFIVHKIEPTEKQLILTDLNRDGAISVRDVVIMLRHIVGKQDIVGCGVAPDSNPALDHPFKLRLGNIAVIKSEGLEVGFAEVIEDSRCPIGAVCVWEGRARILIEVRKNGEDLGSHELTLHSGHDELARIRVGEFLIELLGLEPHPSLILTPDDGPQQPDYVATLVVSKLRLDLNN